MTVKNATWIIIIINFLGFWDTNGSFNLSQRTRFSDIQQNKENLLNSGLCHSGWPQGKTERKQKKR